MYCRNCGKKSEKTAKFCSNCGSPFSSEPPKKKSKNLFGDGIWTDPVKYAKRYVGTKNSFFLMVTSHIIVGIGYMLRVYGIEPSIGDASAILLFIILLPISYLYMLKKVLKELEAETHNNHSS